MPSQLSMPCNRLLVTKLIQHVGHRLRTVFVCGTTVPAHRIILSLVINKFQVHHLEYIPDMRLA
jgi:hypothetical protein